ncbi:diguanylate cyclase [Glaciecola siphonariae]|uniref:diguanylate cyclase n=1 Tax=Glaciecola siphonariae TaxID=521012 RepID=A0ABV9LXM6_9ALTE
MQSNQVMPRDRSYWIAAIVSLFVLGLLALTVSLTSKIEEKSLPFDARYFVEQPAAGLESLNEQSVLALDDNLWQSFEKENLGLSERVHWIKLQTETLLVDEQYLFELNYGLLDNADVWVYAHHMSEDGSARYEQIATYSVGDTQSFYFRPIQHEQFLFPVYAETTHVTLLLKLYGEGPIKAPLRLWEKSDFIEYSGSHKLFMGLFFGYMIAMALSNLFIYATTRNPIFAVYTAYVLSIGMVAVTLHGMGFRYLWPDNIWFQERAIAFFACSTLILIITFSIQVLDLKNNSIRAFKLLKLVRYVFYALFVASFVMPYSLLLTSVLVMIACTTPVILVSSLSLAIKGNLIARYFSGAWAALLMSGIALAFENFGLYELPMDSSYLLMVGAITETLLLALALAISFSTQYKEAEEARALAVENERQAMAAKDELLQVQQESQQALEYSVEERTLELEIAMRELSEVNQELERLSAIDPLTGLMNRRYFDKRLLAETRRSRREQRILSLAMLDIDFFKKINDEHGHLAGDECLKVFASTLQENIKRPSDIICRYGGEEFVVILPATDLEGAHKLMERVRSALEQTSVNFEGKRISMTVSIGLSSKVMSNDDEQAALLAFADKLLYQAKESGRNQVIAQAYSA